MHAFKLGLWTKKDIDLFRYNEKQYELTGDATGSIAAKVGTTMILYYSFLFCDKTRNSEPLANIKYLPILTMSCQYVIVWINSLWIKREILAINPTRCQSFLHVICCGISHVKRTGTVLDLWPILKMYAFHIMHTFSVLLGKYFTGLTLLLQYPCQFRKTVKSSIFRRKHLQHFYFIIFLL